MTVSAAEGPRDRVLSVLRAIELIGVIFGVALIAILHIVAPTNAINPVTVTISEYGRSPLAAVFVVGVVLIAVGSAATLALLLRARICRVLSVPSLGLSLWVVGMIGVAVFQKADWAAGATMSGYIHRAASLAAFIALPVAILTLALHSIRRAAGGTRTSGVLASALVVSVTLLVVMAGLGVYIATAENGEVAWWTVLPLGLVERLIVFAELVALALLVAGTRVRPERGALVAA